MRPSLLLIMAAACLTFANADSAFAQGHAIPTRNSCIKEFYDPEMYNYLTYKNNCSQSLTVVFVAKDGSGVGGTMDLRPGGKDAVGRLAGKTPKVGAFQLYVCQSGYMPFGEDGKVVNKPRTSFECRPKTE
jgi:hypothetical protein